MRPWTQKLRAEALALFRANTFADTPIPAHAAISTFKELHRLYCVEDQKLFKSREWDPNKPELIINKAKVLLEQIDPTDLDESDREWRMETLWFWHHHAISYSLWQRDNKAMAYIYASQALQYQTTDHPNKITRLLWLLIQDKLDEAKQWAAHIPPHLDRDLAFELICDYEQERLFY